MKLIASLFLILATATGAALAAEIVDGKMVLPAKVGNVLFEHDKHTYRVKLNCKACHEKEGEIIGFGKKFAHDLCIGCHMKEEYGGPVKCDGCHGRITG